MNGTISLNQDIIIGSLVKKISKDRSPNSEGQSFLLDQHENCLQILFVIVCKFKKIT